MASSTEQPVNETSIEAVSPESFKVTFPRLKSLGRGAFGNVYLTSVAQKDIEVAVKVIAKRRTSLSTFKRELECGVLFSDHPYIIQTHKRAYDIGHSFVLIQEFVDQGSLFEYVHSGEEISESLSMRYLKQICLALKHIHSLGFVHGDMGLQNIMLTSVGSGAERNVVKLIDFGLTVPEGHERLHGNPIRIFDSDHAYLVPERFWVDELPCARCFGGICLQYLVTASDDIWALGIVFYQMLTYEFPWEEASSYSSTFPRYAYWQQQNRRVRASRFWEEFSPQLNAFLAELLNIDSHKRPSANDAIALLDNLKSSGPLIVPPAESTSCCILL